MKNTGKVRQICEPEKVGTMALVSFVVYSRFDKIIRTKKLQMAETKTVVVVNSMVFGIASLLYIPDFLSYEDMFSKEKLAVLVSYKHVMEQMFQVSSLTVIDAFCTVQFQKRSLPL